MLTINGLEYRNLEEQVRKNKEDILYILEEEGTLNAFGIKVVGQIANASGLPDPATYTGDFGDAYAVGTESPYVMYIYTRANGTHPNNYWFNIGRFPVPGPKGDKGDSGIGNANLSNTPGNSDTNGYTQKAVNGIVQNPNLLINPNFAINQRGQASYTGTVYGVDRWKSRYINLTVEVLTNGVRLTNPQSSGTTYLRQRLEENLAGKTVTLSCKIAAIQSGTGGRIMMNYGTTNDEPSTYINGVGFSNAGIVTLTVTIPSNAVSFAVDIGASPNSSIDIEWAKLEIGSVATEFSPPSIAEELPKCQRYYQRYNFANNMPLPFGIARNERTVSINFNIPKLRTNPTFATSGTVKLLNQNITGLTLINNQYYDGVCRLFIETSGLSTGTGILIAGDTDGYYAFDAEL